MAKDIITKKQSPEQIWERCELLQELLNNFISQALKLLEIKDEKKFYKSYLKFVDKDKELISTYLPLMAYLKSKEQDEAIKKMALTFCSGVSKIKKAYRAKVEIYSNSF